MPAFETVDQMVEREAESTNKVMGRLGDGLRGEEIRIIEGK